MSSEKERSRRESARQFKIAARETRVVANLPADLVRLRLGLPLGKPATRIPVERVSLESSIGPFEAYRVVADGMVFFAPDLSRLATELPDDKEGDQFLRRLIDKRAWPIDTISKLLALTRGRIMLDIGANIGLTSIPRAVLGLFDQIHAFEPEPRNFSSLKAAITENGLDGHMTAWGTAVGAATGEVELCISIGIARHHVLVGHGTAGQTVTVPLVSLDRWAVQAGVAPREVGFIKVDTQGFEPHVLKGAESFLSVPGVAWQLEVHLPLMAAGGTAVDDFRAQIETRFTAFMDLRDVAAGLRPTTEIGHVLAGLEGSTSYTDIVAITKGG